MSSVVEALMKLSMSTLSTIIKFSSLIFYFASYSHSVRHCAKLFISLHIWCIYGHTLKDTRLSENSSAKTISTSWWASWVDLYVLRVATSISVKMASFDSPSELTFEFISELVTASLGTVNGEDTDGRTYNSVKDMWDFELMVDNNKKDVTDGSQISDTKWYQDGLQYWDDSSKCSISDDGVLQGYGKLTPIDTRDSNIFLDALKECRPELKLEVAADCGAGIGRVTKNFLINRFERVHLVEVSPRLLASAPEYIGAKYKDRIECIVQGLQEFTPKSNTYDVIWTQWVIGQLHDLHFVRFLRRCAEGLRPGGVIVLKDNCSTTCTFLVDKDDSSVCRHIEYIRILVRLAGLNIVLERRQKGFPEELYPVVMMALSKD